ncbi:adenylate/guanylate cyclase domain-containing protein [Rhizobium sp. LjRoot98]|uniref:adenylate/guanylate cyclase domain-containing protein n=1 Tax=unclassified Rhizobium TaxID=2613769 RepID=UPI000713F2D5|nr:MULTISPECIES: adenylate/guanylate cyclase domain-containing protein [unclassified Rhizobium]KQV29959.1 adenylate cyclase [Rhizobium sp. Root1204]KQY01061.1 adenylate cyclase [Rhizobium sp. Root1334]KRB96528.1 adenylate cyclase [Rhizobium sp. Root73]
MKIASSRTRKRLHLLTGACLGFFLLTHFSNHALGLISIDTMEDARRIFNMIWRSWPGTVLLYGSLLVHFVLALESLYRRQTLRMPMREALKIIFGLTFPFLIVSHVVSTRVEWMLTGYGDGYYQVLPALWSSSYNATRQSLALILAWAHGCLGAWFWMRGRSWYPRYFLFFYSFAILVPLLALLGFAVSARSLEVGLPSTTWFMPHRTPPEMLGQIRTSIVAGLLAMIGGTLILRAIPVRGKIRVTYPDRVISVAKGFSVLEASRAAGIPHLSICGGRGRCSTCRVRVTEGLERQPPAGDAERATLTRIRAPDNVRLACQLRPSHNLSISPILGGDNIGLKAQPTEQQAAGRERHIAVLFCDLRDFTLLAQKQLPFDTVFLLNRYFETIGEAVEESGGVIDKFIGDGALALFGLNNSIEEACAQALTATARIAKGIDVLNRNFMSELDKPLRIAMGMHAGPAIIGQIGYGKASSLTAVGDTINAASRLEGFAKEYDAQLAVSADLVRYAGLNVSDRESYNISIRGRRGTLETLIIQNAADIEAMMDAEKHQASPPA